MATNKNIQMSEFNGVDYDILYPQTTTQQIKDFANETSKKAFKIGDVLCTARTDLGENWALCNGDTIDLTTTNIGNLLIDNGPSFIQKGSYTISENKLDGSSISISSNCYVGNGIVAAVVTLDQSASSSTGTSVNSDIFILYGPLSNPFSKKKIVKTRTYKIGSWQQFGSQPVIAFTGEHWIIIYLAPNDTSTYQHKITTIYSSTSDIESEWIEGPVSQDKYLGISSRLLNFESYLIGVVEGVVYFNFHAMSYNDFNINFYLNDVTATELGTFPAFENSGSRTNINSYGRTNDIVKYQNKFIVCGVKGTQYTYQGNTHYDGNAACIRIIDSKDGVPTTTYKEYVQRDTSKSYSGYSGTTTYKPYSGHNICICNDKIYVGYVVHYNRTGESGYGVPAENAHYLGITCGGFDESGNWKVWWDRFDPRYISPIPIESSTSYFWVPLKLSRDDVIGFLGQRKLYGASADNLEKLYEKVDSFKNDLAVNNFTYVQICGDELIGYLCNCNATTYSISLQRFSCSSSTSILPTISTDKTYNYIKIKEEAL